MSRKKLVTGIVSLALVGVLAVGGTLAYLSATSEAKENTFTMGKGIMGEVTETDWENGGKDDAAHFAPGMTIKKNPVIKNTSDATDNKDKAYVAFTISYGEVGSYENLKKFATINFNDADFSFSADYTKAYYRNKLAAQAATNPVFTEVKINELGLSAEQVASADTANPQFDKSKYPENAVWSDYEIKSFDITVQGYLVQESGFADAQIAMKTAFPTAFPAE